MVPTTCDSSARTTPQGTQSRSLFHWVQSYKMLSSREKQRKNKSRDQKSQKNQNKKEETSLSKKISDLAESAMRFFTKKKARSKDSDSEFLSLKTLAQNMQNCQAVLRKSGTDEHRNLVSSTNTRSTWKSLRALNILCRIRLTVDPEFLFLTILEPRNLAITEQRGPERKFSLKRVNSLAKARQSICDQFQEEFNQHFISPNWDVIWGVTGQQSQTAFISKVSTLSFYQ